MSLHDQLDRLADTAPRPDIDHALWDRGRALRRRDRLVTGAVALVVVAIIGGLASLVLGPPRTLAPADDSTMPDGAIPSRIEYVSAYAELPLETDLAIGRASVAFQSGGGFPIVIGAEDGRYHRLDVFGGDVDVSLAPALSPDGTRMAWAEPARLSIGFVDLETGDLSEVELRGIRPTGVRWSPDGETVLSVGTGVGSGDSHVERIDVRTGRVTRVTANVVNERGYTSPDGSIYAVGSRRGIAAEFVEDRGRRTLERAFPPDVYPDGVAVQPLGWASDHLVLATAEAPAGSYVEGRHLILFTSPDRPRSEWTFRIVARDLPPAIPISVAVDLIPDLNGRSSQQLTHDFGEPDWQGKRDISWMIGLGVAGGLSVLYGARWLWRRRTHLR